MAFTVAVVGASGRLGGVIVGVVEAMPEAELVASLGSRDAIDAALGADVIVDATHPAVSPGIVSQAIALGRRVLVGTSGWSEDRLAVLRREVGEHPGSGAIVIPNFSLGSALATGFATIAARYYDSAEIIEAHHAGKVDSPSGTAVRTAELMAAQHGPFAAPHADQRARGQQVGGIPIHSLRLDGIVARQEVRFGGTGETLSIVHDTSSNAAYEAGIRAALLCAAETRDEVIVGLDAVLGLAF
jgi:4-hydroxy-tetrahydrodipicolinate reductase